MPSDLVLPIDDADLRIGRRDHEIVANRGRWDGVVVEVEADVNRLAGADGDQEVAREGVCRKRQERGLLLFESALDRSLVVARPGATMGNLVTPASSLPVEVRQSGETPGGEEALAHVADGAFDATLLVAAPRPTGSRLEVVVRA